LSDKTTKIPTGSTLLNNYFQTTFQNTCSYVHELPLCQILHTQLLQFITYQQSIQIKDIFVLPPCCYFTLYQKYFNTSRIFLCQLPHVISGRRFKLISSCVCNAVIFRHLELKCAIRVVLNSAILISGLLSNCHMSLKLKLLTKTAC
jgi:hypothetical protein